MIVITLAIKQSATERQSKQSRLLFLLADHFYHGQIKHQNLFWFINCVYICLHHARSQTKQISP